MQGAENENQAMSRNDEVNVRPSPNFKHKRYLRSRFEEAMKREANASMLENEEAKNKLVESSAQPPLPHQPQLPHNPPLPHHPLLPYNPPLPPVPPLPHNPPLPHHPPLPYNSPLPSAPPLPHNPTLPHHPPLPYNPPLPPVPPQPPNPPLPHHPPLPYYPPLPPVPPQPPHPPLPRNRPLPRNPPPLDTSTFLMNVQQDTEHHTYTGSTAQTSLNVEQADELNAATINTDYTNNKPVRMCRNFVRGTCDRGASCIFAHELIVSQLPGVYTFCRNFQNSICSLPKCKFVHATVFEKEHFFRTGYLPPHTLAHLVEQAPPPPPHSEGPSTGQPAVYWNGAPNPFLPCVQPAVDQYNTAASAEPVFNIAHSVTSTTSPTREWSGLGEASSSTCVLEAGEPLAKKCKNCITNEIRASIMKEKVEKAALANKEMKRKIAELDKKNKVRATIFESLLSTQAGLLRNSSDPTSVLAYMLRNTNSSDDDL